MGSDDSFGELDDMPCTGLIGLCLGQPIRIAHEVLGPSDIGSPTVSGDSECYEWTSSFVRRIFVCEGSNGIDNIVLEKSDDASLRIATPVGQLAFPSSFSYLNEHQIDPAAFENIILMGEGYTLIGQDFAINVGEARIEAVFGIRVAVDRGINCLEHERVCDTYYNGDDQTTEDLLTAFGDVEPDTIMLRASRGDDIDRLMGR